MMVVGGPLCSLYCSHETQQLRTGASATFNIQQASIFSFCDKIGNFNLNPSEREIIKLLFAVPHREIGIHPMRNVKSHYATTLGAINHLN